MYAPDLPRNEKDWIILPRDSDERKGLFFPKEVMSHPAKMNLYMQQACIDFVAKPGETILDPFGGTGTTPVVAKHYNRNCVAIEYSEAYCKDIEDRLERGVVHVREPQC